MNSQQRKLPCFLFSILFGIVLSSSLHADETPPTSEEIPNTVEEKTPETSEVDPVDKTIEEIKEKTNEVAETVQEESKKIAEKYDKSKTVQQYSAGILQPIYSMAEYMSFSAFHWIAFAVMFSGVVSFAFQLVIGKFAVLLRGGLSFSQILTDVQGLVISLVGLFLTTQAATENSTFTTSPTAVVSSALVGAVAGFFFYLRGQATELEALEGRREEARIAKASRKLKD